MATTKKNKRRRNFIIIGAVVLVLLIWAVVATNKPRIQNVATTQAALRTITETVSANGKIQPEIEVKISPDVSGEIIDLYVHEGDSVKKGDLLLRINPDIYVSNVDRLQASLDNARANLANSRSRLVQAKARFVEAQAAYNRNKKLYNDKVLSEQEWETATSAYEVAKAEVDAAEETVQGAVFGVKSADAALVEASKNLQRTSIYAPQSGIISKLNSEKGERVVGTSQMAGTEILRIADMLNMEVSVEVSENDIVRVDLGDTALVEVDAYRDRKFKGIVTEIGNSANTTGVSADQVTNFVVKIRILQNSYGDLVGKTLNSRYPFKPGMSANVEIQTTTLRDVLCVPLEAVATRDAKGKSTSRVLVKEDEDEGDKEEKEKKSPAAKTGDEEKNKEAEKSEVVFLYENGTAKMVKVKTGIQDRRYIQIVEGLKDKQEVISAPYNAISTMLKDGDKVNKVPKEMLFDLKKE